jgi:hypothetical protein
MIQFRSMTLERIVKQEECRKEKGQRRKRDCGTEGGYLFEIATRMPATGHKSHSCRPDQSN